jgi:hypothetical protein
MEYYPDTYSMAYVQIPYIGAKGSITINVIYHNPTMTTTSNGNAFEVHNGWETGNYTGWTAVTNNGSISATNNNPYLGSYSLESSVDGTTPDNAYIHKTIPDRNTISLFANIYPDINYFGTDITYFMAVWDGSTKLAASGFKNSPLPWDNHKQYTYYGWYDDGVWTDAPFSFGVTTANNAWTGHTLQVDVVNGKIRWWNSVIEIFDINKDGLDFNGRTINKVSIGIMDSQNEFSYTLYIDDVSWFDYSHAGFSYPTWTSEYRLTPPSLIQAYTQPTNIDVLLENTTLYIHLKDTNVILRPDFEQNEEHMEWVSN